MILKDKIVTLGGVGDWIDWVDWVFIARRVYSPRMLR